MTPMIVVPTDISPDGVRVIVDWGKFVSGSSVFIPTLHTARAINQLLKAANLERKQIVRRVRVEGGKYGVRVWRLS